MTGQKPELIGICGGITNLVFALYLKKTADYTLGKAERL